MPTKQEKPSLGWFKIKRPPHREPYQLQIAPLGDLRKEEINGMPEAEVRSRIKHVEELRKIASKQEELRSSRADIKEGKQGRRLAESELVKLREGLDVNKLNLSELKYRRKDYDGQIKQSKGAYTKYLNNRRADYETAIIWRTRGSKLKTKMKKGGIGAFRLKLISNMRKKSRRTKK